MVTRCKNSPRPETCDRSRAWTARCFKASTPSKSRSRSSRSQDLDLPPPLPAPDDCIADDATVVEVERILEDPTDVVALWADGDDTAKHEYQDEGAFGVLPSGEQSGLVQRLRAEYVRR